MGVCGALRKTVTLPRSDKNAYRTFTALALANINLSHKRVMVRLIRSGRIVDQKPVKHPKSVRQTTQYAAIVQSWRRNLERIIPFFDYPHEIRRVIYTTNAIESLNMSLRKITKRGSFPNDDAVMKLFYLAIRNASKKWTMPIHDWKEGSIESLYNYVRQAYAIALNKHPFKQNRKHPRFRCPVAQTGIGRSDVLRAAALALSCSAAERAQHALQHPAPQGMPDDQKR